MTYRKPNKVWMWAIDATKLEDSFQFAVGPLLDALRYDNAVVVGSFSSEDKRRFWLFKTDNEAGPHEPRLHSFGISIEFATKVDDDARYSFEHQLAEHLKRAAARQIGQPK